MKKKNFPSNLIIFMLFTHIKSTSLTSVQGEAQLEYFHTKHSVLSYNAFPSLSHIAIKRLWCRMKRTLHSLEPQH